MSASDNEHKKRKYENRVLRSSDYKLSYDQLAEKIAAKLMDFFGMSQAHGMKPGQELSNELMGAVVPKTIVLELFPGVISLPVDFESLVEEKEVLKLIMYGNWKYVSINDSIIACDKDRAFKLICIMFTHNVDLMDYETFTYAQEGADDDTAVVEAIAEPVVVEDNAKKGETNA